MSYVIDLYSTHTNEIDFYIGQVRLYPNENFDPDTKISNTSLSYSCKLDSWELQDTPPSGLRFNSYISKVGVAHDLKETHVSFKRKSFEEVGQYLKECQQNTNQGNMPGDDDQPFWIEFRDVSVFFYPTYHHFLKDKDLYFIRFSKVIHRTGIFGIPVVEIFS